ncbi:MAG: hypothetical protein PV340_04860 [Wolbachia sp.]|nr:hypothetical protein [Wolbachia sp.]
MHRTILCINADKDVGEILTCVRYSAEDIKVVFTAYNNGNSPLFYAIIKDKLQSAELILTYIKNKDFLEEIYSDLAQYLLNAYFCGVHKKARNAGRIIDFVKSEDILEILLKNRLDYDVEEELSKKNDNQYIYNDKIIKDTLRKWKNSLVYSNNKPDSSSDYEKVICTAIAVIVWIIALSTNSVPFFIGATALLVVVMGYVLFSSLGKNYEYSSGNKPTVEELQTKLQADTGILPLSSNNNANYRLTNKADRRDSWLFIL